MEKEIEETIKKLKKVHNKEIDSQKRKLASILNHHSDILKKDHFTNTYTIKCMESLIDDIREKMGLNSIYKLFISSNK